MPHLPPHPPTLARPVSGNPGAWFDADSYPVAALRRSAEGRSVARLAIGADGRVTGCTILSSSGDADLDRATCAIPLARGHFSPARDAGGVAVTASYTLPVRWVLPGPTDAAPIPAPRDDPPEPAAHRGWFERVIAAHHLIGLVTGLFAFGSARVRRWLWPRADGLPGAWDRGDRLPVRRRRPRWLEGRVGRLALAVGPALLLAGVLAWLGW